MLIGWSVGRSVGSIKLKIIDKCFGQYLHLEWQIDKKNGEIQKLDPISDQIASTASFQVQTYRSVRHLRSDILIRAP